MVELDLRSAGIPRRWVLLAWEGSGSPGVPTALTARRKNSPPSHGLELQPGLTPRSQVSWSKSSQFPQAPACDLVKVPSKLLHFLQSLFVSMNQQVLMTSSPCSIFASRCKRIGFKGQAQLLLGEGIPGLGALPAAGRAAR